MRGEASIHRLGVARLLEAFAAGRVSVVAATDHYLGRIARFDGDLRSFTAVDGEGARAAAEASARRYDAGAPLPLDGVPVAVKANIDVAGLPTHGGIGALRDAVAAQDAAVVARLRAAGAVVLGNLNMHEAALGATTANVHFGDAVNPHRAGHTPGGSSGGSGAAVSAGLCAAALGTDTLGSVRIPAAYCGVYGLKPTNGLVDSRGMLFLVERLDCIGPLARSVEDLALMLAAMTDAPAGDEMTRVATLDFADAVPMDADVRAAFRLAADLLAGTGVAVDARRAAIDPSAIRIAGFIEAARAADAAFGDDAAARPELYGADFRRYMAFGRGVGADAEAQGRVTLDAAAAELRSVLQVADAILLPTTPQAAFPHAGQAPVSQADFTALANVGGLPAVSVPGGWTGDGLPVGVQLVGRPGTDAALLRLAARLDRALNAYRPPLGFE